MTTKVDIFSGFLGAGKTTLIKKLIAEAYQGQQLVLIENEFGEIGIDGGFMAEAGIRVNELNSGCICCSLVGDFAQALQQVVEQYHPDRILIEPSGVGKLSDILRAVQGVEGMEVNSATVVCDAAKCRMYIKNFGEFYDDQVRHAGTIVLSRTGGLGEDKLQTAIALLRERNPGAVIITTPWSQLSGQQLLDAIEHSDTLEQALKALEQQQKHHHHHHHHADEEDGEECCCHRHDDEDEDGEECCCHHHHHHDEDEDTEDDHHHDEDEDAEDGHHHHDHHDHDEHDHHHHHHHHHHDHDADEVFVSWGLETAKKFSMDEIREILSALDDSATYGLVLRAKGIVDASDGQGWIHFDHVPEEADLRRGPAGVTGRLCVIGSGLKEDALRALFGV
ncbi:MAG: GTP-binding protein [Oscillospiraceae bacterium]|nr:GTP-binding protein [Oscillospiraceae bacterium]